MFYSTHDALASTLLAWTSLMWSTTFRSVCRSQIQWDFLPLSWNPVQLGSDFRQSLGRLPPQ